MIRTALRLLFSLSLALAGLHAANPDTWVPVRWDGGPLEVARRAKDKDKAKALADPAIRGAIAGWYDSATLSLLDGMPVNCLLLTLSGGAGAEIEKQQRQLVTEYAGKAHQRGLAVLGLVYPGAEPPAVASAAVEAKLDGLVLEGEFPGGSGFAEQLEKLLRSAGSAAVIIPVASSAGPLRKAAWPVLAVKGVSPGTAKLTGGASASATGGLWVDSNMWLVRSLRLNANARPVWLSHPAGASGDYLKSIADAAAAGGRWIVTLQDDFRAQLLSRDAKATALWRSMGDLLTFFGQPVEWRDFAPYGTVGIIFDTAGQNLANSEEFQNLVARRRISYRVIDRSHLDTASLAGLRAVLAFDLAPPAEAERKLLRDFAALGGLVAGGPSWGGPPKDQAYTVEAIEQGELTVYKDASPDPESVARDLNDLLTTPDFGVSFFNVPSVLPYVSTNHTGDRMAIQMVNYADAPADSLTIWATQKFKLAHLYIPGSAPMDLPLKRSGDRTEIAIPRLPVYGALVLQ